MTLTIHRPNWKRSFLILLGLAALLGAVAVAVFQNTDTEPAEGITPNVPAASVTAGDPVDYWRKLELLQDGFLPPAVANYWMRLQEVQDGYLPPAVATESSNYWTRQQEIQDGFLPPAVASESNVGSNGISDSRTNGPQ